MSARGPFGPKASGTPFLRGRPEGGVAFMPLTPATQNVGKKFGNRVVPEDEFGDD